MSGGSPSASTLFPFGQDFQNHQPHWGTYAVYNDLPNRPGNVLVAGKWENLRVGQIARVAFDSGLYICDSTGVAGGGNAVWLLVGPAGSMGVDHFAPRYLVGNTLAPYLDPALPQLAPFVYFGDPGDGSGIAAALAAAAVTPGDIWIRPGTYDLGAGAVVTPLVVPASVRVYGSGYTTRILGRLTGNQGVFELNSLSMLRDMTIIVSASDANSAGSDAVVLVHGSAAVLHNLQIVFTTAALGQLREGIRFDTAPANFLGHDVENVAISTLSTTPPASPTRCVALLNGAFAVGRHVQLLGGNVGVFSDASNFACSLLTATDWTDFGLRHVNNGGGIRLDEAFLAPQGQSVGGWNVSIEGRGTHVMRSATLPSNGSAGTRGISVVAPIGEQIGQLQIDDCIVAAEVGIQFGDVAAGSVVESSIVDCDVTATVHGIALTSPLNDRCHVKGNQVRTLAGQVAADAIWVQGTRHEVEGNAVVHTNANANSQAVLLECSSTTFRGNTVEYNDANGVVGTDKRLTICANEITATGSPLSSIRLTLNAKHCTVGDNTIEQNVGNNSPAILTDADFGTVGDNTIVVSVSAPVAPGIQINGNNNTCIGNVVEGAPGFPVGNAGLGNEIAHNVGA